MAWYNIISLLMMVAILIYLFPRVRSALKNSPKAQPGDWQSVIVPLLLVIGFVVLLIAMVRH